MERRRIFQQVRVRCRAAAFNGLDRVLIWQVLVSGFYRSIRMSQVLEGSAPTSEVVDGNEVVGGEYVTGCGCRSGNAGQSCSCGRSGHWFRDDWG
jgi:hypothetical protein